MILVVTGTGTDVGKTVVTAALVARARSRGAERIAVVKPAQTGVGPSEPGDLADVQRLAGPIAPVECVRYTEPLAPDTAARRAGLPPLSRDEVVDAVAGAAATSDVTIVEGAGGALVRLAESGGDGGPLTILDVAADLAAPVVVVTSPALGTLNHTELTVAAIRARRLDPVGLVVGSWPGDPDLAMRCNADDLPRVTGVPVIGTLPEGVGSLPHDEFVRRAPTWFDPAWVPPPPGAPDLPTDRRPEEGARS
ncbi:ATP-dependent dethiobiotin synthetase BioD [Gordonia araii NBRC 100433]|uniref:ATP-dependent dethiobiotin synthetase BioD n=1 Tax=Gordonia araii NBRC 100433 TaxID=1073574 RepID=G7H2Q8_9ACTN|nr:dethiobiotin synthase [Gordonia araii]NNG98541.1 ATP-dependent dethiobiotin synthetase BioD [Gordonia araii NBRC 100433]GAB10133.1 ATP-dependent dethiobiotin synthetase BioD [Gordonia araii NBRC 100433]